MNSGRVISLKTNKIASYITIFNLVITPLIFLPNQTVFDYYYFPKHVVIMVCSLLFVLQIWLSRKNLREIFVFDLPTKAILVYLLIVFISLFFAIDPKLAITGSSFRLDGFATLVMYIMMFFAARMSMPIGNKVFKYMLVSATIIAVYGILQYFGLDFFRIEPFRYGSFSLAFGTIGGSNFLGSYLVLMIPFTLHFWFSREKALGLISYAALLFCLIATLSRGPWLGAIFGIILYFIFQVHFLNKKLISKQFLIFVIVTVGIVMLFAAISPDSPFSRFFLIFSDAAKILTNDPNMDNAGSSRWFIWSKVVELIKERPIFGFGISNLELLFASRFKESVFQVFGSYTTIDKAHNEYLDIAVSSGIPSLIAYLYFLYTVTIDKLKKNIFIEENIAPLLCAVLGYAAQAIFNISVISVAFVFWILLGLIVQNYNSQKN